ncbi:MAG: 4Fe-4S dicluster domain-containing protein [Bradymonadaceae bacterium]
MSYQISESQLRRWMDALIDEGCRLIAPVATRGPLRFEPIESAAEAVFDQGRTRWSPKEYLLPRQETLFEYSTNQEAQVEIHEPPLEPDQSVLFGIPPCDAAGLARLVAVFEGAFEDPYVLGRQRAMTIVSWTCAKALPECFCTAVGGSPGGELGSDVLITDLGEAQEARYLVQPLNDKGRRLIEDEVEAWEVASTKTEERADRLKREVEASMTREPFSGASSDDLQERFSDDVWSELASACVGCKICTTVCPSCSCFEVYDKGDARCGSRSRCWDGCTQALFTRHATGHNPRPTQAARLRQRVLHKFSYYPQQFGASMCVGCGRCSLLCPAGLDVHQTVMRVLEQAARQQEANP